ncbi:MULTISPECIES: hypothetical protein [Methanothermobacter]|uniref:Uncharacterized protein n=1 Tax=Methanothermobacter wolfeii TaxID=145261 RepID=A0A9E7RVB0_METWO|nr:hypothetical protein [Methanothermobacter wolfeii]UXH32067.1 hypothetical protein N5910_01855 [Methanothermobacter wolfeii]
MNGETFDDPFFGYMRPRPPRNVSDETREEIKSRILKHIKVE